MGAQASRDAGATDGPQNAQEEHLAARAWRTGVPFTLLHDEGFVAEKYQELLAANSVRQSVAPKTQHEAHTTVSGLDEAPMDELQHATDVARVKLFARAKREDGGEPSGSRPGSPSNSAAVTPTLAPSTGKENPPSALAGMVGNTLSRESPECADSEKLRAQRDELLQVYFEQIGARMKQSQQDVVEETPRTKGEEDVTSVMETEEDEASMLQLDKLPMVAEGRKISRDVTPASVFSVGSLRMQLELLREFRVLSPRLFENGVMALVQTLIDSPPFALQDVTTGSPEDVLMKDVRRFCRDSLHPEQGEQGASDMQRQVLLLLLLALGVSSGRVSLLLEFVDELLALPRETATSELRIQRYPFVAWVELFLCRVQAYRIDFALGTLEDSAFVRKFSVKTLPVETSISANEDADNGSPGVNDRLSSTSLATDGSFVYSWSLTKGLAKIGTGLNFTIAGRVYAEVPACVYLSTLEEKRTVRMLVYGFGEHLRDVSDTARGEVARASPGLSTESVGVTVRDIFATADDQAVTEVSSKLLVSYCVGNAQDVCVLEDSDVFALPLPSSESAVDAKVCRAWYGDFDILSSEAMLKFGKLLKNKTTDSAVNNDGVGVTFTNELIEQLLALSGVSPEKMSGSGKLMVVFSCGDIVGAQLMDEGDQFLDLESRTQDSYLSSLLYCGDSLYLNVMYPETDASGLLFHGAIRRCRQLLRVTPRDLTLLENLPIENNVSLSGQTSSPGVSSTLPLYAYTTEGRLIYEIEVGVSEINVNVVTLKAAPEGGRVLAVVRTFVLKEKAVLCCEFSLSLAKLRSMMLSNENAEVQWPLFYTNGASLGVLTPDLSTQDSMSSNNRIHCVLFDCESGEVKNTCKDGEHTGCIERSLPCASVCFDAKNNLLWLYDEHKRFLRAYQNSGKRIPLDENTIPSDVVAKTWSAQPGSGEETSFMESTALTVLSFLYKNAIASDITGREEESNGSLTRLPFAVDVEVDTFKLLVSFTSKYVNSFKSKNASLAQAYILQACLGILNKNLESLLLLSDGRRKQESIAALIGGLSTPLDKLLEFSNEQDDRKGQETQSDGPLKLDERIRVQVASVALDLYTTSIRIFHSDVGKQFTHVLKYLQLWKQSKATKMELKILARLLAHLCTRVDAIYQSILASDDTLGYFLKLVEFAVGMQQRQLRQVFIDSGGLSGDPALAPVSQYSTETSFELISLVNALTQVSFVGLRYTSDTRKRKAFDVAVVVFETMRDACSAVCCDLAVQVKQLDCQNYWVKVEEVLKNGFVGILAPVVLSSVIVMLRNRRNIEAMLVLNDDENPPEMCDRSGNPIHVVNGNGKGSSKSVVSCFFEFIKDNSSKLQKFMADLDVLVDMVDPVKREHTVENVSMAVKTETMESSHDYENNIDSLTELQIPGSTRMVITFDARSRTEVNYDYLTFYKDKSQGEYYGSQFYSGRDSEQNWPGVGDNPPLVIESDHCFVHFHTDGSNTDWGYNFTASAEVLERKKSLQQHWIVFLLESVVQLLDESVKLLVDGSSFAPIEEMEIQNERYLQSDLLKSGVCTEESKNAEVLRLLQDFVDPPEGSDAERVIQALQVRSGVLRPALALERSASFDQITSSVPNKSVNSAVRAVAAAILHHNMWGMDAYAFTQNLRDDISEQLLRGWKNAQKMRDWFHLGDAADAGIHAQMAPTRRRSGRLRRQPSAYKGLSEESLAILCDNVIKRARFLLEITPVSFAYVMGAKRRWGLLAKYGHAIGKQTSSDTQLDKWYNLLDELQAATELRSLFQYRRSSSERLKHGQVKSVTEQVLEFIQSDVDVLEMQKVIEARNQRAASRALGMEIFAQTLNACPSLRLRGILLESFASTLKSVAIANSPADLAGPSSIASPNAGLDSLPRLRVDTLLSGCDESLRQRIAGDFGDCLTLFAKQLASTTDDGICSALITGVLRCCAMDYDLEDSYLLQESRVLPQIVRLLSSESVPTRNAAQSLLGVLLSRFIAGRVESSLEDEEEKRHHDEHAAHDPPDVSTFQRQLFSAVGQQLDGIVSVLKHSLDPRQVAGLRAASPQYLPDNSPGFTASCLQQNAVSWNHSILLWVYCPSTGPLYALKLGDEVRRGPNWSGDDDLENGETDVGTVISIPAPTKVHVRWNLSGLTSQCEFDPKRGIFEVVLVDEGVRGTIFFKGNKNTVKDTSAAKPWSHFGLFLTDRRMLVYKIACGSDKESVFETDYELDAEQWSHVAIVQDEDILRVYVNGSMVSQHLLESFLVMNANVNPAESAIIESAHPLEDSIDEYCPVHIPGATRIRLTFDPLCDIDTSTGFVRFYKDAKCVEFWGEDKYTGKYSDPERNFPGAQSNRARTFRHAEDSSVDFNVLEIPSDRFLVYFHNEGSSSSWGFRILASPEFDTSDNEPTSRVSHLNPYPFYFGVAPGRVLDEPAAKCWIYRPQVLSFPISESDLTTEIQTSFPSSEIVSNCVPVERTLHILALIRTCAETSFGRTLISTPENLRNLMFLSFDDRVPVEIRVGGIKVLKDLSGMLSADVMDAQFAKALSHEASDFLPFVFKRLGRSLNVWRAYDADERVVEVPVDEDEELVDGILELRTSAQGEASLVAAYISLLRGCSGYSSWGDQLIKLVIAGLQAARVPNNIFSEEVVGQVLASLAILGGSYGGAYIGGRVSCCVNVDGKEMVEAGYLVQFRVKSGVQMARVIFDCDQSSTVDVPLTDVAHLDDVEKAELASFLKRMAPFATELRDLYQNVLGLSVGVSPSDESYQPKLTKKENVEVLESEHPYASGEDVTYSLSFRGANEIVVRFDGMSCTAGPNDYIQFKKRGDKDEKCEKYWGEEKYYGEYFPGVGTAPPLRIPAGSVDVHFFTEGSSSSISEWGFKLTAHAFEETLVYPPEVPPPIMTSALCDIRARCIKSLGQLIRSRKCGDIVQNFTTLLPSLTKIANAPCDGRPIQASPKSQIFESKHPYANSVMEYMKVTFSGAATLTISFDPQSRTEQGCDYLCFFKDKSLTDRWGAYQYCGVGSDANWPGVDDRPPLVISADSFTLLWATDGSNVDWGWKFNVTAEFLPEFPLDKSLTQLDARSYRLFETLYEKMNRQRIPLKEEFDEFAEDGNSTAKKSKRDPVRQLLSSCSSKREVSALEWGRSASSKIHQYRVTDEASIKIYQEESRESNVLGELKSGARFIAEAFPSGWLKVASENVSHLGTATSGWVWQRTGKNMHASLCASCANGEDLLTLGVDDLHFENRHSVLEMDESNDEENSLTSLCSPFAFDEFKGQIDRIQSLAYDSHRAMATKAARDAVLTFLSCDPKNVPIQLGAFGGTEDILLLLSHFFLGAASDQAYDNQSSVLFALQKRLKHMVKGGDDDSVLSAVLDRCLDILICGTKLLPKGRGAVRTLESTHPYQDNADQYWDVTIPGATKVKLIFDRRCKSEAGCDWVRIYKSGSNRTETIGPDQIGGREDSENWPGTGGRPPLYVEDDSFEVYFHSDSSNNDWGFKLYAIGIFNEEEETPQTEAKDQVNCEAVVKLLSMVSWILESLSSIPDANFQASPAAFKRFYSAETLHTLMLVLDNSPQCTKTCALQIISNMSQSAAFHAIPVVLIEQVRDLLNVKMRAKHQAEDRVELKSPYLQTLVQCAIAVDLSIDGHYFDQLRRCGPYEASLSLPSKPTTDGEITFVSNQGSSTSGCYQFRLIFSRLVSAVTIGLVDGAPQREPNFSVRWEDNGKCSFGTRSSESNEHILVNLAGFDSRIREGDTVTIQLDTRQQTLVFRKNSVVVALVAGPTGSGALILWEALQPSLVPESDVRLVVFHSSAENRIEFSSLCCSSVALIPQIAVPIWYSKAVDAVSMMLDFRDKVSSTIISRESHHPVASSPKLSEPAREHVDISGAVALEIRFDKRTKLQKSDELRFFYASESGVSPENNGAPSLVLSGFDGELNEKDAPHLFAGDGVKQPNLALSVGDLVVRSLDWEYSDEDGGAGNLGIVQEITAWRAHSGKGLRVRWQENGFENLYRYGFNGRYDVQNLESTKHHNSPLVIKGGSFSFEFVPAATQAPGGKLALSSSSDFAGSLELNGMMLKLNLVELNEWSLSKNDFSVECWMCISQDMVARIKEHNGIGACMELLRFDCARGRLILLSDQLGRCVVILQAVDEKGEVVEHHHCRETVVANNDNTRCLAFGQWAHVALVFSGSSVYVVKNGDVIYSVRCSKHDRLMLGSKATLAFGNSCSHAELPNGDIVSCLPLRGHLYDIRLWDVAFRVEQLRSHFRGLDSVDTIPKGSSLPGTPVSASGKSLSPSMRYLASPRSPRSSLRPIAVPQHMRRWVTTNLTGKDISTVRLNCSVEVRLSANSTSKSSNTVYYEAHTLTSGKVCIGWILNGVAMTDRSAIIGEEQGSYGIELGRKLAHFSTLSEDLAPFSHAEPSGCTSPRRSFGGDSFGYDIFSRKGDVIGCAIDLSTGKITFFVNGERVAEVSPFSNDLVTSSASTDASHLLNNSKDREFDALVSEIIAVAGSPSSAAASISLSERKLYPSASLGPQGAQGVAWNFGQRPFKYEPALENGEALSLLQASGCEEEDAHFEVYDYDEQQWNRIVYRHKIQEISPRLVGWWKLNEGTASTVEDASGNNQQGTLVLNNGNTDEEEKSTSTEGFSEDKDSIWWDDTSSPPAAARRRAGDGNVASPFFPFGYGNDSENKSESLWGYKFFVIPHFSIDTVGRRRFQAPSVRFGDSPHNLLPRHDQQLIKYANKKGQSKDLNVTQLLHCPWSDISPQEKELVRWPALMEIVASAGDKTKLEKAESKSADAAGASEPVKSLVDAHERLSKRFKLLQEFNAAIYRLLPFIAFHAPSVEAFDTNTPYKRFMLSDLVMEHRHRILSAVKRTIWGSALGWTNESGVSFELMLNRPKAMRFRATGKTDSEGRHTLFSQAFRQLQALDGTHFRREDALYHVTFLGENAQDAGGPYRETFAQYCEELQSTQLPLMLPTPNSQHNVGVGREKWLLSPGAQTSTAFQMLEFLGKLMGASIRSKQYLALNLAPLVWKKLAGECLSLDDLAAVDSMLVNSMSKMRTIDRYGVTEEMFEDIVMETFTTLGADNRVIELKPGGVHIPVTFSSRCEYADLVEQARLHESDDQALAILRGLAKVVPAKLLACFSGAELELMVCGSPEVDVDLLEKCTEYSSCSPTDDHIVWFWRALRDFSHDERSAFLRFVWGRSRLPTSADEFPQRFKLQSFNQQCAGRSVDAYMPVAHTCFFSIEIPAYSSESVLREKLLYAIYNCQEIDGDGDSVAANQLGWEE